MKMKLSLYKVVNPASHHKEFQDCIGINSLIFDTIQHNPDTHICLKIRTGFGEMFCADDFSYDEIKILEESEEFSPSDFWKVNKYVYSDIIMEGEDG